MDLVSQFTEKKLYFLQNKYHSARVTAVESNYYQKTLQERAQILQSPSEQHLCKCIIMENTNFQQELESKYYQKYYCIIVQYITKMNVMKLEKVLKEFCKKKQERSNFTSKNFHLRLLKDEESYRLTGYQYNAVEPFMMKTKIPIILSQKISELDFFWLGGGHIDLKIRVATQEYMQKWTDSDIFVLECM